MFSNQSGVARGMFSEDDVRAVNERLDQLLLAQNGQAIIDRHEYCPFHPEATVENYREDSDRRKPGAGMIHSAADALSLDLANSWVIGDAPRDIEAGVAAGCHTILFRDPKLSTSPAADAPVRVKPDHTVNSLTQAIDVIEGDDDEHTPFVQKPATAADRELNPDPSSTTTSSKLETIAEQILYELRRRHEQPHTDFSVAKLVAGIAAGHLDRDGVPRVPEPQRDHDVRRPADVRGVGSVLHDRAVDHGKTNVKSVFACARACVCMSARLV